MAITYLSQGAGVATASSGAALSPLCPATVNAGDILIAHCAYNDTSTTPSTPSGWTLLDGPRNIGTAPNGRHWIFGKIAGGTEDGTAVAFGTGGGTAKRWARVYSFAGRVSGTITDCVLGFAATSHATDPQMPSVTTTKAGSRAVACVAQNDDNAVASATGESGGDWTEAVAEYTATTGTGVMMQLQTAAMASVGTISGGTAATTDDPCGVIGFEIRDSIPVTLKSDTDTGTGVDSSSATAPVTPGAYTTEILADTPIAWYRMQELDGFIQDSSGNGNHATAETGSAKTRAQASGVSEVGQVGIKFNEWGCMRVPDHSTLDVGDVFTLEAWVKLGAVNSGTLYTIMTKGQGGFHFYINNSHDGVGSGRLELTTTYTTFIAASDNKNYIEDLDWHHVAVVKNGASVKLYCDGIEVTGTQYAVTVPNTDYPFEIGAWGDNGYPANATFDEVAVYGTALSQARIQAHYDANFSNPQRRVSEKIRSRDASNTSPVFQANFEGGTDGVTPTTSDAASPTVGGQKWDVVNNPAGTTLEYDTDHAVGTKSLKIASPDASQSYVQWTLHKGPKVRNYHRCYIWLTGYPAAGGYISVPDPTGYCYWSINASGSLSFNAQGNFCEYFGGEHCSPAIPLNQWVRIETWFEQGDPESADPSRGMGGARIFYTDPYGTTPDWDYSSGGGWVVGLEHNIVRWGAVPVVGAGGVPAFWIDEIVSGATDWVGPVIPPGTPKVGDDVGSGVDESSIARAVADTGSGTEILASSREAFDTGVGTEATAVIVPLAASDNNGTVLENASVVQTNSVTGTDTGSTVETATIAISLADTGTGTETPKISLIAIGDTGTGTENATITVPVSGSDTGAGTDTAVLAASYSQADTGTGTDNSFPAVSLSVADTGSGTDNGVLVFLISVTDTGAGTEASAIRITLVDAGAGTEVPRISLTLSDAGSDTEVSNLPFTVSDTGAGTDVIAAFTRVVSEAASGADDSTLAAGNDKFGSDSGTGIDDSTLKAVNTVSDTGAGTESPAIRIAVSDTGTATENATVVFAVTVIDSGTGSDSSVLSSGDTKTGTDTGLSLEFASMTTAFIVSDTGTGSETSAVVRVYTGVDIGTGTEAISFSRVVSDFGGASETTNLSAGNILVVGDTGSGSDTAGATINYPLTDSGSGTDTANVIQGLYLVDDDFGIGVDNQGLQIKIPTSGIHGSVLISANGYRSKTLDAIAERPSVVTATDSRSKMSKVN